MKALVKCLILLLLLVACKEDVKTLGTDKSEEAISMSNERTADYNPLKNAYFGQTHQHTSWSFDAAILDVKQDLKLHIGMLVVKR